MAGARRFPFFHPPGCPRPECHRLPLDPDQVVYFRLYRTKGYPGGVPLFSCLRGRHTFSLRRYSVEFYLHRPHKTAATIDRLVSSCSLRQAARAGRKALSRSSVERRLERFGLHSHRLLRRALRERLRLGGEFQLDEAESFERDRRMAPLTIPVLVHRETRYTAALSVATLAPRVKA
ncbi:MAG TPA: hypothetical protein VKE69_07605, partial [Planctomycetota bacterium]|nr:hypothetical protein [Planctomycetota bacterium]